MKKTIGFLCVAAIAVAMFFSANNANSSGSDISLSNLISMNTANAQGGETTETKYTRYIKSTLECFKVDWQGNVVSNGTHVVCTSFQTDNPNLGLTSCTGTDCP